VRAASAIACGFWCLAFDVGSSVAQAPSLPRPLACYKRYYGLDSEWQKDRFYLKLPSGPLLYDDAEQKDLETRLARPDVEDQFAQRYDRGPIERQKSVDFDPGRVRVTEILRAIYAPSGTTTDQQLESVAWFGARLRVHRRIAPALLRVHARLTAAASAEPSLLPWLEHPGGGHAQRHIAGTDRLSAHAFGIAVDINPKRTEYWRWDRGFAQAAKSASFARPLPAILVEAFEAEGFIWGGRWYHYDTMHFEFRPELLDPQCAP
jgi:hypothetical protein